MPEKIPGAKEDKGKLQMSIVPPEIITAIAEVRRYGLTKYADPENWQRLDPSMLHEALLRHCVALWTDWTARDPESGLVAPGNERCVPVLVLEGTDGQAKCYGRKFLLYHGAIRTGTVCFCRFGETLHRSSQLR